MNYNLLPEEIKDWVDSVEVEKICNQIAAENSVTKDEGGLVILTNVVALITSSVDPANFINEISSSLGVDDKTADKITTEIIDSILNKISSLLSSLGINTDKLIRPISPDYSMEPKNSPIVSIEPYSSKDVSGAIKAPTPETENVKPVSSSAPTPPPITSQTVKPTQAPQPQTNLRPSFKEPVTTSSSPKAEAAPGEIIHPAPFILHEEKPIEGTGDLYQNFSIQRPSFYKPVFSSEEPRFDAYAKPKAATIELGGGEVKKPLPASLKTSPQQVRVVHYSEFKTNVDPFGAQPTISANPVPAATPAISSNPVAAPTPQVPPPIHSNNVVDLKDLPLE